MTAPLLGGRRYATARKRHEGRHELALRPMFRIKLGREIRTQSNCTPMARAWGEIAPRLDKSILSRGNRSAFLASFPSKAGDYQPNFIVGNLRRQGILQCSQAYQ